MSLKEVVLLYNERCSICYRLARLAYIITRGRIAILTMFSDDSKIYRDLVLKYVKDYSVYESMPWVIDGEKIYGGISIMKPIIIESFKAIIKPGKYRFSYKKPLGCEPDVGKTGFIGSIIRSFKIFKATIIQLYSSVLSKRYVVEIKEG